MFQEAKRAVEDDGGEVDDEDELAAALALSMGPTQPNSEGPLFSPADVSSICAVYDMRFLPTCKLGVVGVDEVAFLFNEIQLFGFMVAFSRASDSIPP
jgi:hypothetical protein